MKMPINMPHMLVFVGLLLTSNVFAAGFLWTTIDRSEETALNAVNASQDRLVAVGSDGLILTSSNARQWQNVPSGSSQRLRDVAYADNRFVAVGNDGSVLSSDASAQNWAAATLPEEIADVDIASAAYFQQRWIFTGIRPIPIGPPMSNTVVFATEDFVSWEILLDAAPDFPSIFDLQARNGILVGVGLSSDIALGVPFPLSSVDGINWDFSSSVIAFDLGFDGTRFVASGNEQGDAAVATSVNGSNWSIRRFPELGAATLLFTIGAGAPGYLVLASDADTLKWFSSTDLQSWQFELQDNPMFDVVAWRDGWVGVGSADILLGEPVPAVPAMSLTGLIALVLLLPLTMLLYRQIAKQKFDVTAR